MRLPWYYPTGTVRQKVSYRANKLHGDVLHYAENGRLRVRQHYRDGIALGEPLRYDAEGNLETNTAANSPHGPKTAWGRIVARLTGGRERMAFLVCMGPTLQCSFGTAPSPLVVLPHNTTLVGAVPPAANIMDHEPVVNVVPFGMCQSPANPTVASATAAASGVLTPMPCVPMPPGPWAPGSATVLVGNMPALNQTLTLLCSWGGVIQVVSAGQTTVLIP